MLSWRGIGPLIAWDESQEAAGVLPSPTRHNPNLQHNTQRPLLCRRRPPTILLPLPLPQRNNRRMHIHPRSRSVKAHVEKLAHEPCCEEAGEVVVAFGDGFGD